MLLCWDPLLPLALAVSPPLTGLSLSPGGEGRVSDTHVPFVADSLDVLSTLVSFMFLLCTLFYSQHPTDGETKSRSPRSLS